MTTGRDENRTPANGVEALGPVPGHDEPLDQLDTAILAEIADLYGTADAPPPDLDARVQFAIALEDIDVVVSRLQGDALAGARGAERARTVTFDAESLTIMVTVTDIEDGRIRVDGWLAPAGPLPVELRIAAAVEPLRATADETGRFVFTGVGPGLAQLIVHPRAGCGVDLASAVVTPSIML